MLRRVTDWQVGKASDLKMSSARRGAEMTNHYLTQNTWGKFSSTPEGLKGGVMAAEA